LLILEAVDLRTLCTARLVSRHFCRAASTQVQTLRLSAEYLCSHPETTFTHFPNLKQVAIEDLDEGDFTALSGHAVCEAITDVSLFQDTDP
jgi:hypothetical protein